jgi:toxin CcdB
VARFDVYRVANVPGYFLDVQADFLGYLDSRVVIPLVFEDDSLKPTKHLNPRFEIEGVHVVMMTQFIVAVPKASLRSAIANLAESHDEIVSAIDFLMQGF